MVLRKTPGLAAAFALLLLAPCPAAKAQVQLDSVEWSKYARRAFPPRPNG